MMSSCPHCHRNSLEFSDRRKTVWCLYVQPCGFEDQVNSYEEYLQKYALPQTHDVDNKKAATAK